MRKIVLLLFSVSIGTEIFSQTWADNVAPILFSNCVSCHRPGGIGPFSLLTYNDAYANRASISNAVSTKHMPPWPPEDSYVHFTGARTLSSSQISTIVNWVNNGASSGNIANAPPPPPPVTNALGNPDTVLKMPDYISAASSGDIYQCFVLPLRLSSGKFVSAIEVVPGNSSIVHHVLVYQDTTVNHAAQILDNASPGPGYTSFGGIGVNSAILADAWVPGSSVKKLPSIFGKRIYPNSDIVIQVHYPAGSSGQLDSTKVKLYYNSNASARDVRIEPILYHYSPVLVNGPLSIPANTIKTFEERFTLPVLYKATVLTVAPHMHLIGESIKSYATKLNGDTIRFIDIPHWDFHWQGQYYFQKPIIVDGGSTLRAFATYNNTSSNPHNPNNPPQTINLGEATTDEMMLVYFAFTQYQAGDENIIIDSSLLTTPAIDPALIFKRLKVFPNPAAHFLQFENPEQHRQSTLSVWDMAGRKIHEQVIDHAFLVNIPIRHWPNGVYNIYLRTGKTVYSDRLLIQHE
ncbi:MAG: T9SS type A sorting domain-containing protein [Sphingobacteriales bacterium]|nr:T9SS type A sorting domain-containing protein [Sphingobacteriales bacterium]